MYEHIKEIEKIISFLNEVQSLFDEMQVKKSWCESKTQDLLHELELVHHTFNENGKLAKELADVRQDRRIAKNTIELLNPLVDWCDKYKNTINALKGVLGEMRKTKDKQTNRLYYKRADNSHEIIKNGG